jgi:isopentenyldiphosphate isomerase
MEIFDVVDEHGIPTGETVAREDAHRHGIRHRTSHVWLIRVYNGKAQVLLQKRSPDKDSYPGCYDISSAGHIPAGDDFIESALRELEEELGIKAKPEELIFCGQRQFRFCDTFHGREFRDNQVSNVYLFRCDIEAADFDYQKSEIESLLWMDLDTCIDMVITAKAPNCIQIEELEMISSYLNESSEAG